MFGENAPDGARKGSPCPEEIYTRRGHIRIMW